MRHHVRWVTLLIVVACGAPRADAKGASARVLFTQAEEHYRDGRYLDALDLYKQAYAKRPLAGFYINMGQCYRQLFRWKEAIAAFEKYLELTPKGKHRAKAEQLIAVCKKEMSKQPVDRPPPSGSSPGDHPAGVSKAPAGPGTPPQPTAGSPTASQPATPPAAPILGDASAAPDTKARPAAPTKARRGLSKIVFWTGVGLSAALLATTAITGAMALSKSDEYKDPATPASELQDLKDSGEALRTTSTVTFVAGVLAAAGTTVLFFLTDWGGATSTEEHKGDEGVTLGAAPAVGGGMLSLGGRF